MILNKEYSSFKLIEKKKLNDIESVIYTFEHKILGTKLIYIKNKDKEKTFNVTFKTPSPDSKGYQHILEHSVLRGSKKYNFGNKEVFANIIKKSLLTNINASTYPDKTIYYFSTMIKSEFFKVMDIYIDAVLNALVLKNENYFRQEGWRWEKDENGKYFINGVVFNEMKGRLSSIDSLMDRMLLWEMFPKTEYSENSGGDPNIIPNLRYSDFIKYYKKYYHPTNATFFIYGDIDILKVLEKIENDFLLHFKKGQKAEETKKQKIFLQPIHKKKFYLNSETKETSFLNIAYLANEGKNIEESFILAFLFEILLNKNSLIYKNLINSNLISEVSYYWNDYFLQNFFVIEFAGLESKNKNKIEKILEDSLIEIFKKGINQKIIKAQLNKLEYSSFYRNFTQGKGSQIINTILKNQLHNFNYYENFEYKKLFLILKKEIKNGGLEKRIKKYFLENNHKVSLILEAKKDFNFYKKLEEKIKKINKINKSKKEIKKIDKSILEFEKYKNEAPPKNLSKLISAFDKKNLPKNEKKLDVSVFKNTGVKIYFRKIYSKKISKKSFFFDGNTVEQKNLTYLKFLTKILTELAPKGKNREEFLETLAENTGRYYFAISSFLNKKKEIEIKVNLELSYLSSKENKILELLSELFSGVEFDKKIILQNVNKQIARIRETFASSGNYYSSSRADSKISQLGFLREEIYGVEYYLFLKKIKKEIKENFENLKKKFQKIFSDVFVENNLIECQTTNKINKNLYKKLKLKNKKNKKFNYKFKLKKENEAIIFDGLENSYNTLACKVDTLKESFSKLESLKSFLNYGFLWDKIREDGGAYGASFSFCRHSEVLSVSSYMDSRILGTYKDYNKIGDFLKNKDFNEIETNEIIVKSLGYLILPKHIFFEAKKEMMNHLKGITLIEKNRIIKQKRNFKKDDFKKISLQLKKNMERGVRVTFTSSKKIKKIKKYFDKITIIK